MDREEVMKFLNEDEEGKALLEELQKPLLNKRNELLGELKDAKTKLKEVGDVDELRSKAQERDTFASQLEEFKKKSSEGDEKYDSLKQTYEQKLEEATKSAQMVKDQFKNSKLESMIVGAVSKHKGVPELLKPVIQSRLKADFDETGALKVEVMTKDGKPFYTNGENNEVREGTIEDLVQELKSDDLYRRAFDGTGSSGSGSRPTSGSLNTQPDMSSKDFNLTEAMKEAKSRG